MSDPDFDNRSIDNEGLAMYRHKRESNTDAVAKQLQHQSALPTEQQHTHPKKNLFEPKGEEKKPPSTFSQFTSTKKSR